jgi:hypothetical protein
MIRKQSSLSFCRSSKDGTTVTDFGESVIDHSQNKLSENVHPNKMQQGSFQLPTQSRWKRRTNSVNANANGETAATIPTHTRVMIRFRVESAII